MMGSGMTTGNGLRVQRRAFLFGLTAASLAHCSLSLAAAAASAPAALPVILVLGDSLSAEYGLARGTGWVALLEKRLAADQVHAQVVNASISGETTAGGRTRLPKLLAQHHPAVVVIELGGNDAIRGLPLAMTREHLDAMVMAAQKARARVLVVGMQVPPNYGRQYNEDFARTFADVARAHKAALVPFLLKGIADRPDADAWFQADRIHPKSEAHPTLLNNVWTELRPLIR
jgi:acyl-CoA thioesterase I